MMDNAYILRPYGQCIYFKAIYKKIVCQTMVSTFVIWISDRGFKHNTNSESDRVEYHPEKYHLDI